MCYVKTWIKFTCILYIQWVHITLMCKHSFIHSEEFCVTWLIHTGRSSASLVLTWVINVSTAIQLSSSVHNIAKWISLSTVHSKERHKDSKKVQTSIHIRKKKKKERRVRCTQLGRSQKLKEHKGRWEHVHYKEERRRVLRSPHRKEKVKKEEEGIRKEK